MKITVESWSTKEQNYELCTDKVVFVDMNKKRNLAKVYFGHNFYISLDLKDWLLKTK